MGKNKKYKLENAEILDFVAEGKCIIKNEGEVIFVDGANIMPGDIVDVWVTRSKKKYAEGKVLQLVKPSGGRTESFCSHFGVCGGCKWQHVPYEVQLIQKSKQVKDQIQRIGKVEVGEFMPIIGSDPTRFYRNKLEFTFSNSRWITAEEIERGEEIQERDALGFHIPKRFDKILPIEMCYLQSDPSNAIRNFVSHYAHNSNLPFYDHVAHQGFYRTMMIRTTNLGQTMVAVQFAQDLREEIQAFFRTLNQVFPNLDSVFYFINTKKNDTYFDLEPILVKGRSYIEEEMEGIVFQIGVKSFFQTNSRQAYVLYDVVRKFADLQTHELVFDLYTGTGTIANFVARWARWVVGIEYVPMAIEDAKVNAKKNKISNTEFIAGDIGKIFNADFIAQYGKPDIVITDPPRAGMDKAVIENLLNIEPLRIVYVSCNPATQARDLQLLSEKYKVDKIQPVDMFPHTYHIESVALLTRK